MRISDWSSDVCSSDLPLGDLGAKLDLARCARLLERLRVGVRDQEIHPLDLGTHHVRDRVAARAANADHGDTRGQLVGLRSEEFDAHRCSPPFLGYSGDSTCPTPRSEEHTSELQSLMRISYAVFCLKKKKP